MLGYTGGMGTNDPLSRFLPPVRQWFRETLGEPTPPQREAWPHINAGRHTLILAPTGSGKTLAAFLACLDQLWRQPTLPRGVRILYVSPLKALNNDIYRNLQVPLTGVAEVARQLGVTLPAIDTAVRTGDTPTAERQRLVRRPPHVLITTPESLHLLLTSRARETLRGVTHCIVDEIHALCPTKRGVFLALLLERLQALNPAGFVRIGLSATQRPLDAVARFLGGADFAADGTFQPRPVAIVDAGIRKDLDLEVRCPVEQFGALPEPSVWPSIYRLLFEQVQQHRSTIVFARDRRSVERITAHLNALASPDESADADLERQALAETVDARGDLARAHHGSVSLEARQQTEQALKEGRLAAVVSTASLELGIDMGAVDLVCQVESPGNVARALQRVGRAGHIVGQKSKGRLIPKTAADLVETAVLAREMTAGRVEALRVPANCLDVLAQQLVACAAMDDWDAPALYALVRRAGPYADLSPQAFESVLELVSGRYQLGGDTVGPSGLAALQPRLSWDRVHNQVRALPGTRSLALVNGGAIPDTGQYAAYTSTGVRIGELDEEFVYERRVGDAFLLGTNAWRIERIEADRVEVSPAEGAPALLPFWKGEGGGRSYDLGSAVGLFLRELTERLDADDCLDWLRRDFHLDEASARNLRWHVRRQLLAGGAVPTDRTLLIEASRDQLGDWQLILLSPFGSRLHLGLRLTLEARLRERLGYRPQCLHHADGVLIRLTDTDEPITDLFAGLTPDNVEQYLLPELADSALFALRFRQNAARALLLPRVAPGRRAPLWLQRLRGRDLLQVARKHADFPLVAETIRECLDDHLDLPHLRELLAAIGSGAIRVVERRADTPSPFASGMVFAFQAANLYEQDSTESEPGARPAGLNPALLDQLVAPERNGHLLDPRAIRQVEYRLRGVGQPPRSATEMAEWLRRLGDLTPAELEGPMAGFLAELAADGRAKQLTLPAGDGPVRWILAEDEELYQRAFLNPETAPPEAIDAARKILHRFLATHALVGLEDILRRYPFDAVWTKRQLEEWTRSGRIVQAPPTGDAAPAHWSLPPNLEQVQRSTLAILRREVVACPPTRFADFLMHWQYLHPQARRGAATGLGEVLERLQALPLPTELWEQTILPFRVLQYQPRWLDDLIAGGTLVWVGHAGERGTANLAFLQRDQLTQMLAPASEDQVLDAGAERALDGLRRRGACFVADLAADVGLAPSAVRAGLWALVRRGFVTNDRLDVVRRGEELDVSEQPPAARRRVMLRSLRRPTLDRPEGRWSLVPWGQPDAETNILAKTALLLDRYGIVSKDLAALDPWMPPWKLLYEVLTRLELTGEVRRGYFVEGLHGAQFAVPEAARLLTELEAPATAAAPLILLHSLDPANLYGSGAPFDIKLLDGGTRPLTRRLGAWLILKAGRPLLLIEQHGKRLTALPSASQAELAEAVKRLLEIVEADRGLAAKRQLTVETWNEQPVTTSAGKELLEAVGFVRDYQSLTWYAGWR